MIAMADRHMIVFLAADACAWFSSRQRTTKHMMMGDKDRCSARLVEMTTGMQGQINLSTTDVKTQYSSMTTKQQSSIRSPRTIEYHEKSQIFGILALSREFASTIHPRNGSAD